MSSRQTRLLRATNEEKKGEAMRTVVVNIHKEPLMFTSAARVEGKMDTSAIRSVSGTGSAGRTLLRGFKGISSTGSKKIVSSSDGYSH